MRIVPGLLVAALAGLSACGPPANTSPKTPASGQSAPLHPVDVSEEKLASAVAQLLQDRERSPERTDLLVGVVRRQLARAAARFDGGHRDAGFAATIGALHLVRLGEYHPEMLEGPGRSAILNAAEFVARSGNEGQALALYTLAREVLPDGDVRRDVDAHLQALKDWREGTRSEGTLQAAGDDQRVLVDRALIEARAESVQEAEQAMIHWIGRAITYSKEQLPPTTPFERDEAIEAYRAVRTGALAISALHLRFGDPTAAIAALDANEVARVVSPNLHEALRRAGDDDPDAWFELFRTFDAFVESSESEVPLDTELARAASWGAAVELYRAEPDSMRGIMPIATWLLRSGLPEAALPIIEPAVTAEPDPRILSWAMSFVLQAVVDGESVNDVRETRRIFTAAEPLLKAAAEPKIAARVTPSPARLRYVMGAIETRAGELTRARDQLVAAIASEPTTQALRLLAAIDRQRGDAMAALKSLDQVNALASQAADPAAIAETDLSIFEIQRDVKNEKAAEAALEQALRRALDARELARTGADQANAERTLARVLEYYQDFGGARRATQRAYEASANDIRQLTVTVLDASRRALTRGDLAGAREAARRAVEANLADEDVVYVALWLKLVEDRLNVPSDGTKEEAFAAVDDDSGWPAKLRAFGSGRLGGDDLLKAARDRVERTEALFYGAMALRSAQEDQRALQQLERVAQSETIQLVEVTIARDLLSQQAPLDLELPKDVDVP